MKFAFFIHTFLLLTGILSGQESKVAINDEGKDFSKLKHAWQAQWITHPSESTLDYGVFLFRKTFDLKEYSFQFRCPCICR